MKGFIKIPRDFLDWEWWGRVPHHFLFEWLLIRAAVTDKKVGGVLVRRGSVLTTWKEMENAVMCSRGTLSRALSDLSESGNIVTRTDCRKTIVTICHYEDYNGGNSIVWTDSGLIADYERTDTHLYNREQENEEDIYSACVRGGGEDGFVAEADCRAWMARYNRIALSFGAPQAGQLNAKRRLLIGQRVRERGRGSVDLLFGQLEKSGYFFGEGSRGFRGDFTNLWSSDVFTKVCEGYYIPREAGAKDRARQQDGKLAVVIDANERKPERSAAQLAEDRRNGLLLMVKRVREQPDHRFAKVLRGCYESGELRELGIDWQPDENSKE